ncbi:phage holin family protein [Tissierella sp. MB52-C2]|uniref:phage holin family protein n=1 Tax=Tissierella sp. MB52-C2 TaxID=3070999 RepID=UPI00280B2049|nr:phage holin family protein [Tissierella sp. MB52-C2]WMM23658.1 phage holin family protein [Tissierella sp. MB52-C2]
MEYGGIAIIPLLIGILEVFKRVGLKDKYIPVVSVVLGVVIGIGLFGDGDIKIGLVQGIFIGLSAVGLYSGTKNTLTTKKE